MKTAAACLVLAMLTWWPSVAFADDDLSEFAFQPHPGAELPLTVELNDEHGRAVRLGQFFAAKPVVLVLEYLHCQTLCGLTLENVVAALAALPLGAGRDYEAVAVSIDPRDTPADAAAAKAKYLAGGDAGWHFLTGAQPALQQIAETVGFPYRYDPGLDQYLHPAGFVIAAPDGWISRYVFGVDVPRAELQTGLSDAAKGRAVDPLTRLLLLCRLGGAGHGRYTAAVETALVLANLAGLAGLVAAFVAIRRRRHG